MINEKSNKKVLIFSAYYYPAHKAGGTVRSVFNLTRLLSKHYNCYVVTSDRDYQDTSCYPGIVPCKWGKLGNENVFYAPWKWYSIVKLMKLIKQVDPDILYLNSLYCYRFSILPLFVIMLMSKLDKVVLAPRGEFSSGALKISAKKKALYLFYLRALRLYKKIKWHATSEDEFKNIQKKFAGVHITLKNDLVDFSEKINPDNWTDKENGVVKIAFIARITKMKNMLYCFDVFKMIPGTITVTFDIYGAIDDQIYYERVVNAIKELPANIKVEYKGAIKHSSVVETFQKYDLFFLPTLGENFCHSIIESLYSGTPVLISDQTPWRNLQEKNVGYDLPLACKENYVNAIKFVAQKKEPEYRLWRQAIHDYAIEWIEKNNNVDEYLKIFE
ncbi:MAG: glycosyltransferase [Fibrobacter sp.]|nr:glycosyltransferase [Fibrobacter sp.]